MLHVALMGGERSRDGRSVNMFNGCIVDLNNLEHVSVSSVAGSMRKTTAEAAQSFSFSRATCFRNSKIRKIASHHVIR